MSRDGDIARTTAAMARASRHGRLAVPHLGWVTVVTAVLLWAALAPRARSQPDPASVEASSTHSPRGALWRAMAIPGWGQVYNRQYIKLPFLYGAIGGLVFLVSDLNGDYLRYRRAYLYKSFQELVDSGQLTENPNENLKPYYDELAARFGAISSDPLRSQRNKLRRNRDLSVVGIGLIYGLSVLDAYISAHLLDFDVGEDLTLLVRPDPTGFSASLTMRF